MKIESKDLLLQMQAALKDEFVAQITEVDGALRLLFANGQSFEVSLEEK